MSFSDLEPIFVVGAPRSGTTLLQLILNAHPDIAIHGEVHFFDAVLQLERAVPDILGPARLAQFFEQLKRVNCFRYLPGIEERLPIVQQRLRDSDAASYEMFFRLLLEVYAEQSGAKRCGEKTPQNIRYLSSLLAIFPKAKIIHIVRDPRDVVASLIRMPWAPSSIVVNALKWKIDLLYVRDFLRSGGVLHELKYEDLVTNPEASLRPLCRYVGVPWNSAMLEFHRTADENVKDQPWKDGTRNSINTRAISRWKTALWPKQASIVQVICKPFLEHYGYFSEPISVRDQFALPWRAGSDTVAYFSNRLTKQANSSREHPGMIFGEESRIKDKLGEAILTRRL